LEGSVSKTGTVEIIVVGNELLNGTVLDTNSHWLSKVLDSIGLVVSRKTTIRDDLQVISKTFDESIRRKPEWIFTIGGLGPTFDDMTLKGLARALRKKVILDKHALNFLKQAYSRRRRIATPNSPNRQLSKASLKMAEIPEGSIPIPNPVGSAPAVLLERDLTKIVSLPGVPTEMKAIFKQQILPMLREQYPHLSKRKEIWIRSIGVREFEIALTTARIMKKYSPHIYLKSHPSGFDGEGRSLLKFQLISLNPGSPLSLENAARVLETQISKLGGESSRMTLRR
jgi:nicotinamide-nucleotide amidase